jgi:hypothetical protein
MRCRRAWAAVGVRRAVEARKERKVAEADDIISVEVG